MRLFPNILQVLVDLFSVVNSIQYLLLVSAVKMMFERGKDLKVWKSSSTFSLKDLIFTSTIVIHNVKVEKIMKLVHNSIYIYEQTNCICLNLLYQCLHVTTMYLGRQSEAEIEKCSHLFDGIVLGFQQIFVVPTASIQMLDPCCISFKMTRYIHTCKFLEHAY